MSEVLLIHSNAVDGNTTFTDSSPSEHSIVAYGQVNHDTAEAKFGTSSIYFDRVGDYLYLDDHDDWSTGSGDFTLDLWHMRDVIGGGAGEEQTICAQCDSISSSTSQGFVQLRYETDNTIRLRWFYGAAGAYLEMTSTTTISDTTSFHHIAVVRYDDTISLYIDGTAETTTLDATGLTGQLSPNKLAIGRLGEYDSRYLSGWVDEFRFLKGEATWTEDFTPPVRIYGAVDPSEFANQLNILVDHSLIDSDLTHFPLTFVLSDSAGKGDFDASTVFDTLGYPADDDFTGTDGDAPDTTRWTVNPPLYGGTLENLDIEIQGNELSISGTGATPLDIGVAQTNFKMSGDFDFSVDMDRTGTTGNSENTAYMQFWGDDSNRTYIGFADATSGTVSCKSRVADVWSTGVSDTTVGNDVKLRLVRSSSTVSAYFDDGSGWELIGSETCTTMDCYVVFYHKAATGTTELLLDNLTVSADYIVWDDGEPNRKKIAITEDDGVTQLYGEIGYWDTTNKAVLRVSRSDFTISSTVDTRLILHYDPTQDDNREYIGDTGDTTGMSVWDSDFVAVYHMVQDPDGDTADSILDSTSNNLDGTPNGTMTSADLVDSGIGRGLALDGVDDFIDFSNDSLFNLTSDFTFEVIFDSTPMIDDPDRSGILDKWNADNLSGWSLELTQPDNKIGFGFRKTASDYYGRYFTDEMSAGIHYIAIYYPGDGNAPSPYLNALVPSLTAWHELGDALNGITNSTTAVKVGKSNLFSTAFKYGAVIASEVRISSAERSADWIKATNYAETDALVSVSNLTEVQLVFEESYNIDLIEAPVPFLDGWSKRIKVMVDNTNIDSDLTHFPVPIVLGKSVGQSDQNLYEVFTELEDNDKKIAITKDDGETELYAEIENWDYAIVLTATPDFDRDIGSSDDGTDGMTVYGSPVDNGTYYTFDGSSNGLYLSVNLGNTSTEVCLAKVRIHDKEKGTAQVIWKDGGITNGVAIGIDASGNLGIFGRDTGVLSSITIPSTDYEDDVWYDIYCTRTEVVLLNSTGDIVAFESGTCSSDNGTAYESLGFAGYQSPITATDSSNIEFFDGDIDFVKIYTSPNLVVPYSKAVIRVSKDDLVLTTSSTTNLYLYFDSTHEDNTTYIGDIGDSVAQNVWDDDFVAVYHMAQDPSGTDPQLLDSTSSGLDMSMTGAMTSDDLVEGDIGKAIDFDGTDDYFSLTTTELNPGGDDFSVEAIFKSNGKSDYGDHQDSMTLFSKGTTGDNPVYVFTVDETGIIEATIEGTGTQDKTNSTGTVDDGATHVSAMRVNRTSDTLDIVIDGSIDGTVDFTGVGDIDPTNSFKIGIYTLTTPYYYYFRDLISEVRYSSTLRSIDWLKTTNYAETDDLLTFGAPEVPVSWLGTWANRIKIVVDNTNIDSDLTHFPLAIVLGDSVGASSQDLSAISTELAFPADDAFPGTDGDTPDLTRWDSTQYHSSYSTSGVVEIQSNKLDFQITADASYPMVISKFKLSGDFDIQVDWASDTTSEVSFQFGLLVGSDNDSDAMANRASINRLNATYQTNTYNTSDVNTATSLTSGKFRMVRTGSSLVISFWDGSAWLVDLTDSSYGILDTYIKLRCGCWVSKTIHATFDNFTINSADRIIWDDGEPNRKKIAITEENGVAQLFAEIENWDTANAVIRVSKSNFVLKELSESFLYLYYDIEQSDNTTYIGDIGDSPGQTVWDSYFQGVFHMAQDPSGTAPQLLDSTSNSIDGTSDGTMTTADLIDGDIGKAIDFDGTDDCIITPSASDALDIIDTLTIEAIANPNFTGLLTAQQFFVNRQQEPNLAVDSYGLFINVESRLQLGSNGGNIKGPIITFVDQSYYFAGTYDDSLVGKLFKDGVEQTLSVDAYDSMVGGTNSLTIGARDSTIGFWDGAIQEIRISNIVRSDSWIKATQYVETDAISTFGSPEFYVPITGTTYPLSSYNEPYRIYDVDSLQAITGLFEEIYGIGAVITNDIEEIYTIASPPLINLFIETYGLKMGVHVNEYYDDVFVPKLTINEYYDDTYIPIVRIILPYNNARRAKQAINELWNIPASPELTIIQPYAVITGDQAITLSEQNYDLRALDTIIKSYEQPYYMVPDSSTIEDITVDITVDGVSIDIIGIDINAGMDKYAILGTLTLASETDYVNCPLLGEVECVLNGYSFTLFIETKTRQLTNEGGTSYSISMVSPTAKLDSPYSKTMVLSFTTEMYASEIVQQMADYEGITVDWQIIDWAIPSYAISANDETPLTVIKKVVNAVGAIVQTKPNGDMLIISKYPLSPKDFETSTPGVVLSSETDIISIDDSVEINDGINAFVITDQGTSSAEITLEEEAVTSTSKIIRGFRVPFDDGEFDLETSGGTDISINKTVAAITANIPEDFDESEEWEYVEFVDSAGTTSYPIYEVIDSEWAEEDLGAFQISEDGTLTIVTPSANTESLLKIKYKTKYWEWIVTGPESRHAQLYVPELETT